MQTTPTEASQRQERLVRRAQQANNRAAQPKLTTGEFLLIAVLSAIVHETMAYPPVRPGSDDSFLPADLVEQAQKVLGTYGLRIKPARVAGMTL